MKERKEELYSYQQKTRQDLTFYAAGKEQCRSGYQYGPTVRNYTVIHFILQGKGRIRIGEQDLEVHRNQAFIIPANVPSVYRADEADPWKYCWICFLGLKSGQWTSLLQDASSNGVVLDVLDSRKYESMIDGVLDQSEQELSSLFLDTACLYQILGCLFKELGIREVQKQTLAARVRSYIELNYADDLRIHEIADYFHVHPNYLIRQFTQTFGISPKHYILNYKLNKAALLLNDSSQPISFISDSLGFQDQTSFSRAFKNHYGCSPLAFRKANREADHQKPGSNENE